MPSLLVDVALGVLLGLAVSQQGKGSMVAKGAAATARRIARAALDRELDATVAVALELGVGIDELLDSLRRRWKEAKHAARV